MQHPRQDNKPVPGEHGNRGITEQEQLREHTGERAADSMASASQPQSTRSNPTAVKPASVPSQPLSSLSSPHDISSSSSTTTTTTRTAVLSDREAVELEQAHVHAVYSDIAPHFSSTRYKPWPVVSSFLQGLAPGSAGLDVGCGNGKYLSVNPSVYVMGSDFSAALARIARDHGGERRGEVCVADGLALPYRPSSVDFVICVAVLHHLSTRARRREGVGRLLECVRARRRAAGDEDGQEEDDRGGKVLMYVWALEQRGSRRGWDEGAEQDQLVPWVMKGSTGKPGKSKDNDKGVLQNEKEEGPGQKPYVAEDKTYQRYYHLYRKGELEEDVEAVGGRVLESGYDRDNWWVVACRGSSS